MVIAAEGLDAEFDAVRRTQVIVLIVVPSHRLGSTTPPDPRSIPNSSGIVCEPRTHADPD